MNVNLDLLKQHIQCHCSVKYGFLSIGGAVAHFKLGL